MPLARRPDVPRTVASHIILLLLFYCCLFLPADAAYAAEHAKVAIIISSKIRPYLDALEGFKETFPAEPDLFDMSANPELARHMVLSGEYDLAVSIGPAATDMLWGLDLPEARRLSCMVLDLEEHVHGKKGCGVDLRIPLARQLDIIRARMPDRKKTGILYNPSENSRIVDNAMEYAEDTGHRIIPIPVTAPDEILPVFSRVIASSAIDSMIFIPDSTVTSSRALIKHLVKTAFINRIAVAGYNSFFMKAGAVVSFVIEYQKSGRSAGELASSILAGKEKCAIIPPPFRVEWNDTVWKKLEESVGGEDNNMASAGGER